MRRNILLFILVCMATLATKAVAQHTITFCGDTVTSVRISENNGYLECKPYIEDREMVFPPEAWIDYMTWKDGRQILLERKAKRTKTTAIDSNTWLHLDSLMAEIGICRPTTAANLSITEQTLHKYITRRSIRKRYGHAYLFDLYKDQVTLENFDQWLTTQYETHKDTNTILIRTDDPFSIRIDITLKNNKHRFVSIWRYGSELPYYLDGRDNFNLNIYRHLCALMPKTFDFSYEDVQKRLIIAYFDYLINK